MNRRQEEEVKRMTATKDGAGRCVRCVILEFLPDGNALDIRDRGITVMWQKLQLTFVFNANTNKNYFSKFPKIALKMEQTLE